MADIVTNDNDVVATREIIADDELDAPITAEEVDEAIHRLKHRKAAGVDGILN
jgi:predicted alpha/beta-hydrolase family hydrolase